jgi:hypothetical protein
MSVFLMAWATVAASGMAVVWLRSRTRRAVLGALLPPPRDLPVAVAPKGGWLSNCQCRAR